MKYLLCLLAFIHCHGVIAQGGGARRAKSMKVVKFDFSTRSIVGDVAIPFDEEFYLDIDGIAYQRVIQVGVFEVRYTSGKSNLKINGKDPKTKEPVAIPNARPVVSGDSGTKKTRLKIPQLQPNKDFDIFLFLKLSPENQQLVSEINRAIFKIQRRSGSLEAVYHDKSADDQLQKLLTIVNDKLVGHESLRTVFLDTTLTLYCKNVYPKFHSHLSKIADNSSYDERCSLKLNDLLRISSNSGKSKVEVDLTVFSNMIRGPVGDVFSGYLPINFNALTKRADTLKAGERIAHLDTTLKYYIKLRKLVEDLSIQDGVNFQAIISSLDGDIGRLAANRKTLVDAQKSMSEVLGAMIEGKWLVGTSGAKDLQADGKNYFSVLAGFSHGFAKTNYNKVVGIPKIYLGFNINFRALNKDLRPYKDLDRKPKTDTTILLTRRSMWHFVGLNVGLTLGSMNNSQFDNFYANTSLIVGPSVRIARMFRVSAGPMFLTRIQMSPVSSQKKPTTGVYVSAAVDMDFLEPVTKIINMVFK